MTDFAISYDLKAGNPSPHKAFLDAAESEGLLYVWKGQSYVNRLPNTTIWGVFDNREEANAAFSRALATATAVLGYKVTMTKRLTCEFTNGIVNSDVRKVPDPAYTGVTSFETSRLHQLNDPFFA
jgi:hypothetical protein